VTKEVSGIGAEVGRRNGLVVAGEVLLALCDGVRHLDHPRQLLQAPPVDQDGDAVERVTWPAADLDHVKFNAVHLSSVGAPLTRATPMTYGLVTDTSAPLVAREEAPRATFVDSRACDKPPVHVGCVVRPPASRLVGRIAPTAARRAPLVSRGKCGYSVVGLS
jgi:hypothetical protein